MKMPNESLEQRMKKIALMIEKTTKKIIRKEFKKIQRDLIKGVFKK